MSIAMSCAKSGHVVSCHAISYRAIQSSDFLSGERTSMPRSNHMPASSTIEQDYLRDSASMCTGQPTATFHARPVVMELSSALSAFPKKIISAS